MRPRHRFVREREVEIADAVLLAERKGSAGVMKRGFGSAQDRVDPRDLLFAANLVHGLADTQPVVEGRVRGVHHHLVLLDGP